MARLAHPGQVDPLEVPILNAGDDEPDMAIYEGPHRPARDFLLAGGARADSGRLLPKR